MESSQETYAPRDIITIPRDIFCAHDIDSLNTKVCSAIVQYFCCGIANKRIWLKLNNDISDFDEIADELDTELCNFENVSSIFYLFSDGITEADGACFKEWAEIDFIKEPQFPYDDEGTHHIYEVTNNPAFLYKRLANTEELPKIIADYANGNELSSISKLPNQEFCDVFIKAMLDDTYYKNL